MEILQGLLDNLTALLAAHPLAGEWYMAFVRFLFPALAVLILYRAVRSLLRIPHTPENWGQLSLPNGTSLPLTHWENILGRSKTADIYLNYPSISRQHAALCRGEDENWTLYDLGSKGGTAVNGEKVASSVPVKLGDTITLGGVPLIFLPQTVAEREEQEAKRRAERPAAIWPSFLWLTVFQVLACLQLLVAAGTEATIAIPLAFLGLTVLMWLYYAALRATRCVGFEMETIAFFLSTLSLSITASSAQSSLFKQFLAILLGLALFLVLGLFLRDLSRVQKNRWLMAAAAIGLLALFLVWAETNLDGYKVQILNLIAVNAILALSLNLIYGFTGMFSLGHAGFMAIGAYVSALCVLPAAQKEMMWILEDIIWPFSVIHTPFWFSVVAGGFVAAIFGLFIAIPVLRLGGDYLGIATLGFAEIIRVLIVNLTPITNGSLGIKGIPFHASLLVNYGWLLITLYCMVKLLGSNFGNIFKAIRDDEIAAKVMGIDTFRTKVLSFCLGAFFAGVGGALLGNLLTTIDPKMFTFLLTFNVLMIVVAGGLGSLTGSILGSAVITVLLEWLRAVEDPITLGGFAIPGIPGMRMVVFSLVLLCIILYRREGIMGMREITWDAIFDFFSRRKRA